MCDTNDCPICMECIVKEKNCVTTECGHSFHTNCLMKSVAHNGFGCPYCRNVMAEKPVEEEDEEEDSLYSDLIGEEDEEGMFDEYSLRGMRFLFQRLEGEEYDEDDLDMEEEAEREREEEEEEERAEREPKPSVALIAQKLIANGVNFEQLLKVCLLEHDEYAFKRDFDDVSEDIYGKIRIIVSNFRPEDELPDHGYLLRIAENANMMYDSRTMPAFDNMASEVLKTICRQNGVRTDLQTAHMAQVLKNMWINIHDIPTINSIPSNVLA